MLALGWLIAFFFVGRASSSRRRRADRRPGPRNGAAQTPFEAVPLAAYSLPMNLSKADVRRGLDARSGCGESSTASRPCCLHDDLVHRHAGAITCLQWLLNLTLYRDNSSQIDRAVQGVAEHIFWPLLGVHPRHRRASPCTGGCAGKAAVPSSAMTCVARAATVLGMTLVLAPSKVAGDMDDIRTLAADGAMTGYSSFAPAGQSAAGFPDVPVSNDSVGASRSLANSMWNTYAVTVWCLDAFNSLDVCRDVGHDYLTQDERWKAINERNNNDRRCFDRPERAVDVRRRTERQLRLATAVSRSARLGMVDLRVPAHAPAGADAARPGHLRARSHRRVPAAPPRRRHSSCSPG